MAFGFLRALLGAEPIFFTGELGHEGRSAGKVGLEPLALFGDVIEHALGLSLFRFHDLAARGEFQPCGFDLLGLFFAKPRIRLEHSEPEGSLLHIVGRENEGHRIARQRQAVGGDDHLGVLLFEGRDVAFEGPNLAVGAAHGLLDGANFLSVVTHEPLPQRNPFFNELQLAEGTGLVRLGRFQEPFGGGDLRIEGVALALEFGFGLA